MKYQRLGSTGLRVSELCLGTMTFGESSTPPWNAVGVLGDADAKALVDRALDAGVNFFDTANVYSIGESERILGQALGKRRDEVVLATKVNGAMGDGPNDRGQSRQHVMAQLEASLKRLGTDHIDLYQVHSFDHSTPLEETLSTLDDAVRQGKVRYIGCSNFAGWQLSKAVGISAAHGWEPYVSTQSFYSLVGRDLEHEVLPAARDAGLGVLVWSPLAGGLLSGKYTREGASDDSGRRVNFDFPPVDKEQGYEIIDALQAIAEARGASVPQVALAWLLAKPGITSVIIGAKRLDQLDDNLGAVDVQLTADELARLDKVSAIRAPYPVWMQQRQGRDD